MYLSGTKELQMGILQLIYLVFRANLLGWGPWGWLKKKIFFFKRFCFRSLAESTYIYFFLFGERGEFLAVGDPWRHTGLRGEMGRISKPLRCGQKLRLRASLPCKPSAPAAIRTQDFNQPEDGSVHKAMCGQRCSFWTVPMGVSSFYTSKTKRLSWTTNQALFPLPPNEWEHYHITTPPTLRRVLLGSLTPNRSLTCMKLKKNSYCFLNEAMN